MRAARNDLPVTNEIPGFTSRKTQWGEFTVGIETVAGGFDPTERFRSLPGGRCQRPHWGYLIKGRMRIKYSDHEEVISAGDAYYMSPGHIPVVEEDAEVIEFSPVRSSQTT
jgi:hypothetical protein